MLFIHSVYLRQNKVVDEFGSWSKTVSIETKLTNPPLNALDSSDAFAIRVRQVIDFQLVRQLPS